MLEKEPTTYRIAGHFIVAMINGDTTGLEDKEEAELNAFLEGLGAGVWDCDDAELDFTQDEVTGLWAECFNCKFYREV